MGVRWGWIVAALFAVVLGGCSAGYPGAASPVMGPEAQATSGEYAPMEEEVAGGGLGDEDASMLAEPPPPPEPGSDGRLAAYPAPSQPSGGVRPEKKPAEQSGPVSKDVTAADVSPPAPGASPPPKPGAEQTVATPLLIYNATVTMAVFEVAKSLEAVQKLAKDLGGYLVRRDDQRIIVRVPAARYRDALDAVGKLGDVLHRAENVEDVTDQFYDLTVRVQNARALRQRLEQLLAQAKNVEEALQVERELARVTAEIERMEGRLKLYRELIAFSTITVEFRPRATEQVGSGVRLPFPWLDRLGLPYLLSL